MKKTKANVRKMNRRKKTKKMPVQATFGAPKIFQKTIGLNVSPQLTRKIGYQSNIIWEILDKKKKKKIKMLKKREAREKGQLSRILSGVNKAKSDAESRVDLFGRAHKREKELKNKLQQTTDSYVSAMVERFGDTEEKWIEEAKEAAQKDETKSTEELVLVLKSQKALTNASDGVKASHSSLSKAVAAFEAAQKPFKPAMDALNATREALSLLKIEDHSLKLNCSTTSPARYKKGPVDSNRVRKPKSKVRKKNKRNRKRSAVRGRAKNLASTPIRANRNRRRRNSSLPRWLQKPEPAPENQDPWMPDFAARRSPDATFRGTMLRRLRPGIPEVWRPASKAKTGAATKSKGQEQVVSLDGFYHIKPPAYHEDVWGSILTIDGKSVYANNDGEPFWEGSISERSGSDFCITARKTGGSPDDTWKATGKFIIGGSLILAREKNQFIQVFNSAISPAVSFRADSVDNPNPDADFDSDSNDSDDVVVNEL